MDMLNDEERSFLDGLYDKYAHRLFLYSYSQLIQFPNPRSLAEECVQETFESALKKIHALLKHDSPEGWLMSACKKNVLSMRRKIMRRMRITETSFPEDTPFAASRSHDSVEEWIMKYDLSTAQQQLVDVLTEQERSVYQLFYANRLSLKETAKRLNLSEAAVRGATQRIRAKAKKIFSVLLTIVWCFFHI